MPHKILILEDDYLLRKLLKDSLALGDYQVIEARSGQEALELVGKNQLDLAVVDLGLPDISGWEVCRRIRQDPHYKDLPLIVLTATSSGWVEPHKTDLRINHCMSKPYNPKDLIKLVKGMLDHN